MDAFSLKFTYPTINEMKTRVSKEDHYFIWTANYKLIFFPPSVITDPEDHISCLLCNDV